MFCERKTDKIIKVSAKQGHCDMTVLHKTSDWLFLLFNDIHWKILERRYGQKYGHNVRYITSGVKLGLHIYKIKKYIS